MSRPILAPDHPVTSRPSLLDGLARLAGLARYVTHTAFAALAVAALLLPMAAVAQQGGGRANGAHEYFTDVELVNQDGEPMRLYTDLLQNKIVLINSIYTDCTGMCPLMSKSIERIQDHVGDRLGKDVYLISISVDPETDTPEKLKKFAETFHAKKGWYFLTGKPENVEFALKRLGQYVEDPETHQGIMIMGNESTGLWKKAFGLANASKLLDLFDSVLEDDGTGPVSSNPTPGRGR